MKINTLKLGRTYSIYDLKASGRLVAALSWDNARGIYAGDDDRYLAVYKGRKGKLCVKWLSTNLEATKAECIEMLDKLMSLRRGESLNLDSNREIRPIEEAILPVV